ncbi:hypothetical protein Taro_032027 [Colocasia esculenta]|uniref:Uncharacterized protein n=1 Tax=Colocasia esculenta TaxID=4460 RepID=A0A843W4X7_COLES|nr:hypothetical protein [Colocasia esculenta]
MAGLLPSYGVMVGLALALVMACGAVGAAEQVRLGSDVSSDFAARSREEMDTCDLSDNPIRMHTDGLKDTAPVVDTAETGRGAVPERQDDGQSRPQPKADMVMPRSELAAAPEPSPSGSTRLAVSGMMCVGVLLLGLVMA